MKPRFLTLLLVALLGLAGLLFVTEWLPWLDVVQLAGGNHWATATTVVTVLIVAAIGLSQMAGSWWMRHRSRMGSLPGFGVVLQFMGCVFLVVLVTGASFVAPITGGFTNAQYVSSGGSVLGAKNAASAGQTIFVGPGHYTVTNSLAKDGVNWWLSPGCTIAMTNYLVTNNAGIPRSIFDDRDGAVSFSVGGYGDLLYDAGRSWQDTNGIYGVPLAIIDPNIEITGGIYFQNSNTVFNGQFRNLYISSHMPLAGPPAAVWIDNARKVDLTFDNIYDANFGGTVVVGVDEFDDPITVGAVTSGLWWELGDLHVNCKTIRASTYAVYGAHPSGENHVAAFWLTAQMVTNSALANVIYLAGPGTSSRWKTWIHVDQIEGPSALGAYALYAAGSHYLRSQKIMGNGSALQISLTPEKTNCFFWADIMKMESNGNAIELFNNVPAAARFDLNVQHIAERGSMTAGVRFDGAGNMRLNGARITITNSTGVPVVKGGTGRLELNACNLNNLNSAGTNCAVCIITNSALSVNHSIVVGPTNKFGFLSMATNSFRAPFTLVNSPSTNLLEITTQLRTNANAL